MLLPYIGLFFWSMVKFLFAPATALLIEGNHWSLTYIIITLGACTGATISFYLSVFLINLSHQKNIKKGRKKKAFTRRNKVIIKTKNSIGKVGLALLTASFISIPLGSIITAKFYRHQRGTIFYIYGSIFFVGGLSTLITYSV